MMNSLNWRAKAECGGSSDDRAFSSNVQEQMAFIEEKCRICKVTELCLLEALENPDTAGVWGGMTQPDRRRLINKRKLNNSK